MRARCRSAFIVVEQICGLADKLLREHLRADWFSFTYPAGFSAFGHFFLFTQNKGGPSPP